jgi:DMSO/TMAO reductase YedYZ molybdopterin-dependent catalytic subunit
MIAPPAREKLIPRQLEPFNAETPLGPDSSIVTPSDEFYVRSHFPVPQPSGVLHVDGAVEHSFALSMADLQSMHAITITATMECAGNGRARLSPPVTGVSWGLGAVANATWTGVRLRDVLDRACASKSAVEWVFAGGDRGSPAEGASPCEYARSLPISDPIVDEALLAYEMSGEMLPLDHGGPLRLIVPRWYGMASVKWLERVTAVTETFTGFYQVDDYVMRSDAGDVPCREMAVRAVILSPSADSLVAEGKLTVVSGFAWSGSGSVTRVELSVDGGKTWRDAEVVDAEQCGWARWTVDWIPSVSTAELLARATDSAGNEQPLAQVWNSRGYGNNAAWPRLVEVRPA